MEHKDRMTNLLAGQLKQKVDDEDKRIARATKEREEKLNREMKEKEAKLREALAGIAAHRNEQVILEIGQYPNVFILLFPSPNSSHWYAR